MDSRHITHIGGIPSQDEEVNGVDDHHLKRILESYVVSG